MENENLIQLSSTAWLIPGPTNIGVIVEDTDAILVDSGNDKEAGRKINRILQDKQWMLKGILNTHSNADHIGGNAYLQRQWNCEIFSGPVEQSFIEHPFLESCFLWGGYPVKDIQNKFFQAKPSPVTGTLDQASGVQSGKLNVIPLPGHYFDMAGILTGDGVFYIGDSLFGEEILNKYKIPFIFDVEKYKETILIVRETAADVYVPSHGKPETDIRETADKNLAAVDRAEAELMTILSEKLCFEDVLKQFCDRLDIRLDYSQYALVGSTVRSFLSWLYNSGKIAGVFYENKLFWHR